jgi:CRISPR-associated protein Csy1
MADYRIGLIASRLAAGGRQAALDLADDTLADGALPMADRVATLVLRARIHEAAGDLDRSILDLEGALALDLAQSRVWNELGLVCADAGRIDRSIAAFERAVHVDAGYARGWNNLGNALRGAGRTVDAVRAFERATAADPAYVLAWANLGAMRREAGDDAGAEAALLRALALAPDHAGALMTLAGLLRQRGDLDRAAPMFRRASELDSRDANALFQLGSTLAERDDLDAARAAFGEALQRDPGHLRAALAQRLTLPMVPAGVGAIAAARSDYDRGLHQLEESLPAAAGALPPERILDELRWSNFLLAYQGGDDTDLQRRYAALAGKLITAGGPEWRSPLVRRARGGSRVRVGFASAFFRDTTAGRYFERWVTDLPREQFEVWVYHLAPQRDALTGRIAARADHFRSCPLWRPSQIAPRIRADQLDVLVYPELGMAAVTFALAALRLAPLQCAGWGHPVTTGHSTVDVYLSSAAMEPPGSASHYVERLVTLPGIGTTYPRPDLPVPATRTQFGLPEGVPLLLCPQSLFKIHPDNDRLFARVLGELPSARLVYFEGRHPRLTAAFAARLAAAGITAARTVALPQCSHDDYLRVNALCDLMLDTVHWSGGNTSLDALASGLPIVTLPGTFMRSRQSAGMLRLMGLDELVAADPDAYVAIAARLCTDRGWRTALTERINANQSRIFDDPAPLAALAAFLRQ